MSRPPEKARAWVTVNLSHLEHNLRRIRHGLPPWLRYIAVVKANAYGHGLEPVATRLMRAHADAFAVANLAEASRVQSVGSGWPVLVLSALLPTEYAEAAQLGVCPVISSHGEAAGLGTAGLQRGEPVPVHLKVDTGMGRLGVWFEAAAQLLAYCLEHPGLRLEGLCTHFASAESDPELTGLQRRRFLQVLQMLPAEVLSGLLIHADNSAGLDSFPDGGPFNAARIGLLQFGVRPGRRSLLAAVATRPVLSFHARVGLVKSLPAGMAVSYGQTHCLRRPSRLAVVTAGYADGIPTALSNRGSVLVRGRPCPIVGRVTMDQTIVDITDLASEPLPGEPVTLIGKEGDVALPLEDFAASAGLSPWEVLCAISARTQRHYLVDTAV